MRIINAQGATTVKVIKEKVTMPYPAFRDRTAAGRRLVKAVDLRPDRRALVRAVPRGGVMVADRAWVPCPWWTRVCAEHCGRLYPS